MELPIFEMILRNFPHDAPKASASGLDFESPQGGRKSLHIVRGHFARYTAEAPLFRKHVGVYYHPMHSRGSLQAGQVVKDYLVKPKAGVQP